ncbi:MAG: hypothetical protein KGZ40_09480 [Clostridiales bacterium]|nr:hypothetical protein [Clostridiales bacterium]
MPSAVRSKIAAGALVVALFASVLAGQAAADSLAVGGRDADTGRALGRAGFAYLTGVRTFVAAVLWNRIDPIFHDYYEDRPLQDHTYMLPTVYAIVALDPQFDQTYYVAAWILARRGAVDEARALAALGTSNNPDSGLLLVNEAQIAYLFAEDTELAIERATDALRPNVFWRNLFEQHDSYATVRSILDGSGNEALAAEVSQRIRAINAEIDRLGVEADGVH